MDAEITGFCLAEQKGVERPGIKQRQQNTQTGSKTDDTRVLPVSAGQRTQVPEYDAAGLRVAGDIGKEAGASGSQRIDSEPGQQDSIHIYLPKNIRQPVYQPGGR